MESAHGFGFLELLTVVALLALLAGTVAPMASVAIEAARVERANKDVDTLARAVRSFHTTTGTWPAMDASGNPAGVTMLVTGSSLPPSGTWSDSAAWEVRIASGGDLLANHLFANRPGGQTTLRYPENVPAAWFGPYLDECPLDPWGRPYVVNVVAGTSSSGTQDCRLMVLSAGPDRRFQTSVLAAPTDTVLGDDIAAVVGTR